VKFNFSRIKELMHVYGPFILVGLVALIGLGPIRRVLRPIIPDILEYKTNVNAVCDGANKVYLLTGDSGDIAVSVIVGGCIGNTEKK